VYRSEMASSDGCGNIRDSLSCSNNIHNAAAVMLFLQLATSDIPSRLSFAKSNSSVYFVKLDSR
jgi:hypothetical protein